MRSDFGSRLPLARAMLDRDHLSRTRSLDELCAEPGARALVLHEGRVLLDDAGRVALVAPGRPAGLTLFLGRALVADVALAVGAPVLALVVDAPALAGLVDRGLVAATAVAPGVLGEAPVWGDLRRLGARFDDRDAGLVTQALALANWHAAAGFSPRTGHRADAALAGWVRRDSVTGAELYPRTDTAVIVSVLDDDDRLLLGSNALWEANRFSLLAGFVEPGESFEAAVVREVAEEAGLRVVEPRYLASQPWPFPASLMVGFEARLAPGADPRGAPDGDEIVELRWFSRAELAAAIGQIQLPGPASIARAMIEHWFGAELDDGQR